jgi:5-amino-6-(5-phosphoribosylamino)uracil reductase
MDLLRAEADAVLIGAGTLRAENPPLQVRDPARRRDRREKGRDELLTVIILTASCDLPDRARVFDEPARERLVLSTVDAPKALSAGLVDRVETLRFGQGQVDLAAALSALRERGIERLLVEGGGGVNASFLAADLIDELAVTLCPVILGGADAPTPVEGTGFDRETLRRARLESVEQEGGELFLRYTFHRSG